jgi:pseudouridine kinase
MKDKKVQVCVIGGATVDIFGTAKYRIVDEDSNIGSVTYSFGGVGRNIANNLSRLSIKVELLCALGNDNNASEIIEHCKKENIGLNHSLITDKPTATYLSVNQPEGDIYVGLADMLINEELTTAYLSQHLDFLNSCEVVVLDTNLNEETHRFLVDNLKTKIFVDPVSTKKAEKLRGKLYNIKGIKPNYIEAVTIAEKELSPKEFVEALLQGGVEEVYLTLGNQGVVSGNRDCLYNLANFPGMIVNTTGCGDAFLAGVIYGELQGLNLEEKSKCGLAAAAICCRSKSAISEYLSEEELLRAVREQ